MRCNNKRITQKNGHGNVSVHTNNTMIKVALSGGVTNYGLNVRSQRQKKVNIQERCYGISSDVKRV
jgi:hypothetical protein